MPNIKSGENAPNNLKKLEYILSLGDLHSEEGARKIYESFLSINHNLQEDRKFLEAIDTDDYYKKQLGVSAPGKFSFTVIEDTALRALIKNEKGSEKYLLKMFDYFNAVIRGDNKEQRHEQLVSRTREKMPDWAFGFLVKGDNEAVYLGKKEFAQENTRFSLRLYNKDMDIDSQDIDEDQAEKSDYEKGTIIDSQWITIGRESLDKDDEDNDLDIAGRINDEYERPYYDMEYESKKFILENLRELGTTQSVDYFINQVKENQKNSSIYYNEVVGLLEEVDRNYAEKKLMQELENGGAQQMILTLMLTDLIGSEEARKRLDDLIEMNQENESVANNWRMGRAFITPNHDKEAITNLRKFYQENIKFEEYKVNERMNEREVELLKSLIGKDEKVLEMGCGAGRLITELTKDGYDLTGYDFTKRHVEITKEAIERTGQEAKVFQGDWHNNALANESLDAVYSLGRNILHDYSIVDQVQLFREANRILAHGGRFIFDIANREKGGYKKMAEGYANEMEKRGIRNFRYGSIYDSPDGEHFATRYAYSHEDIEELARLTGFRIVKVEKLPLETGQGDENLYYVLEKV